MSHCALTVTAERGAGPYPGPVRTAGRGQDMAGHGEQPLAAAAAQLGITPEALRKRLQRGTVDGCKRDGEWYVRLDSQQDTGLPRQDDRLDDRQDGWQDGWTTAGRQAEGSVVVTPALIENAIERTGARYLTDLDTMLTRVGLLYQGQIAAKDSELAAKDALIAELRRRAELAEAQLAAGRQDTRQDDPSSRQDSTPVVTRRLPWWWSWWPWRRRSEMP